jgi:hypothetical protein
MGGLLRKRSTYDLILFSLDISLSIDSTSSALLALLPGQPSAPPLDTCNWGWGTRGMTTGDPLFLLWLPAVRGGERFIKQRT